MILRKIFRDEADLQVSTEETVENEETTEPSDDESQEDDSKPAEDAEETVSDDAEVKSDDSEDEEKSDDDDLYTEDEEEYIGQFDLPDDIKTSHDALKYLVENQGKTESDTKLDQVNEYLKSKGIDGVDGLLNQTAAPAGQPAQPTAPAYVSATDTLNKNVTSGVISQEEANIMLPLVQQQDATAQLFGRGMEEIMARLESIEQGHQAVDGKQSDADYRGFIRESKKAGK